MNNNELRLAKCFSAVFPDLDDQEIRLATTTNVDGWDSVASVTLITLIEEEFGVEVDADDLERLVSFESVLEYLNKE